jgi:hypothetical protein
MKKFWIYLVSIALLFVAGCAGPQPPSVEPTPVPTLIPTTPPPEPTATPQPPSVQPTPTPTSIPATLPPEPTAAQPTPSPTSEEQRPELVEGTTPPVAYPGLPLPTERGELFSASGACAICHTNLTDESGADVSIDTFWRSTMMANAARDPYWQASVRAEALDHPDYQAVIEDKCATCHMPMARFTAAASGKEGRVLEGGFLDAENEWPTLAMDGVSCTLCHQISEAGLGQPESFSGGFVIDTDLPVGERLTFGPYPVGKNLIQVMQSVSGFIPVRSLHITQAELCATCHTLYTPYVDATGQIAGEFPEQMPYLEWTHSDYRDTLACQDCHMPAAQGAVRISKTGGPPRSPFAQHVFVGGNAYMLEILRTFGEERQVTASSEQFEAKREQVVDQLQNRTAALAVEEIELSGSQLTATVTIQSLAGHKFPTGFPARRAWLHLMVQDAAGEIIFECGAVNPDGSIVGNDNDASPLKYEPHYQVIDSLDQVQIYESIMRTPEGSVTTALLRGAGYVKDNRLLPSGFDKGTASEDIAVHGQAMEDADFLWGGDRVPYTIELGNFEGPFTVTVELLYQSVGYRWAENLRRQAAPETDRFLGYYEAVPNLPVVVAKVTAEVGD